MSKENSNLKSVLETVGVVVGSFIFAIVVIVAATKKESPEPTKNVVENTVVEEKVAEADVKPVAEVKVAEAATEKAGDSGSISGEKIAQKNCAL
jgi:hypothetical protein